MKTAHGCHTYAQGGRRCVNIRSSQAAYLFALQSAESLRGCWCDSAGCRFGVGHGLAASERPSDAQTVGVIKMLVTTATSKKIRFRVNEKSASSPSPSPSLHSPHATVSECFYFFLLLVAHLSLSLPR